MREQQRLITPLVESSIQLEPTTPPAMPLNTRIQRAWSLLFGRRENTLQPIYANRAGMLGTVNLDLNGWTQVYAATCIAGWTDMGAVVDLVLWSGCGEALAAPYVQFGMATGVVLYTVVPTAIGNSYSANLFWMAMSGSLHARCQWYNGVNAFDNGGYVIGYTAPSR